MQAVALPFSPTALHKLAKTKAYWTQERRHFMVTKSTQIAVNNNTSSRQSRPSQKLNFVDHSKPTNQKKNENNLFMVKVIKL